MNLLGDINLQIDNFSLILDIVEDFIIINIGIATIILTMNTKSIKYTLLNAKKHLNPSTMIINHMLSFIRPTITIYVFSKLVILDFFRHCWSNSKFEPVAVKMFGIFRKILVAFFGNPEAEQLRQALLGVQKDLEVSEQRANELKIKLEDLLKRLTLTQREGQTFFIDNQRLKDTVEELEEEIGRLKCDMDKLRIDFAEALQQKQSEIETVR